MNKQEVRNTAAGMVRDALARLTEWEWVQDLRRFDNTKEEAARLLDFAENALSYFERHYDFPQEETKAMIVYPEDESVIPYLQDYGVDAIRPDGNRVGICRHVSQQDAINTALMAAKKSEVAK